MRNILDELQPIFHDVFDDDSIVVTTETDADMIDGWDSLSHIRLVAEITKHFGIRFALGELQSLKNVGDMVELINEKLAEKE